MRFAIHLFGTVIFIFSGACVASDSDFSFDCEFNRHYASHLNSDKTEKFQKGQNFLSIVSKKTAQSTFALDGSYRATNSKHWELVSKNDLGGSYVGNDGDLLTIMHKQQSKRGQFQAVLQWTSLGYAFSSIGVCQGQP